MEDESGIDIFIGALRYPFTDRARLFVGGLVGLLSLGWLMFIQNMTRLFIWVKFFARVVDGNRETPDDDYQWLNQI